VAPLAAQLPFDPALLVPRNDSMVLTVRGQPVGWFTSRVTRANNGIHATDQLNVGAISQQLTQIDFDLRGRLTRVQLGGTISGISIRASLEYRRNRVRGVTVGSSAGLLPDSGADSSQVRSIVIPADTVLPPGTIDDNAILFYLPALPWAEGARFSFPVFFGQENKVRVVTLTALRRVVVGLRNGPVEVWEVELTGGLSSVRYFVTESAPHRLVRMYFTEVDLTFTLQN
jgi:hypothetical protein